MMCAKASQEAANRAAGRRYFSSALAGAALVMGMIAAKPATAAANDPKPIGGGVQAQNNGPVVHYYPLLPARQGVEFSSISDFDGILGAAHVENMGTLTIKATGQQYRLPFKTDIRFMQGNYVGQDTNTYWGTYALLMLRIQQSHGGPDIHCVSAGVAPSGLVSTVPVDPNGLYIDYPNGRVDLRVRNQPMNDYQSLSSALANGPFGAATIKVLNAHWKSPVSSYPWSDNQQFFRGNYSQTHAIAEFTIDAPSWTFKSDVDSTSHEDFAVVAREWNGLWF